MVTRVNCTHLLIRLHVSKSGCYVTLCCLLLRTAPGIMLPQRAGPPSKALQPKQPTKQQLNRPGSKCIAIGIAQSALKEVLSFPYWTKPMERGGSILANSTRLPIRCGTRPRPRLAGVPIPKGVPPWQHLLLAWRLTDSQAALLLQAVSKAVPQNDAIILKWVACFLNNCYQYSRRCIYLRIMPRKTVNQALGFV